MTARAELARRVDELARKHSGPAFAEAVRAYSEELDEDAREELQQVLLERVGGLDQAVMDRVDARGWLRRQWDKGLRDKAAHPPPRR